MFSFGDRVCPRQRPLSQGRVKEVLYGQGNTLSDRYFYKRKYNSTLDTSRPRVDRVETKDPGLSYVAEDKGKLTGNR